MTAVSIIRDFHKNSSVTSKLPSNQHHIVELDQLTYAINYFANKLTRPFLMGTVVHSIGIEISQTLDSKNVFNSDVIED
ncbi:hypothetical protein BD408DRAFT_438732 [Parasitella parasitica]|nr:hypothetical protein BD408DRAFT_438732 [Parasitella parasitica]